MTPYERLANAIIILAAKDYREALLRYDAFPCDKNNAHEKAALERFFRSGWFGVLTSLDGDVLMQKIQQDTFGKVVGA